MRSRSIKTMVVAVAIAAGLLALFHTVPGVAAQKAAGKSAGEAGMSRYLVISPHFFLPSVCLPRWTRRRPEGVLAGHRLEQSRLSLTLRVQVTRRIA